MSRAGGLAALALIGVLAIPGSLMAVGAIASDTEANCAPATPTTPAGDVSIAGFSGEQLVNAALIMQAGAELGMSRNDQIIAVMVAIGESTLRVLDYGDLAGPDSRGLFQQRDNWGTLEERMDPKTSATLFYNALAAISEAERETLPPSIVGHRVQINQNPYHYEPFHPAAVELVDALSGGEAPAECSTPGAAGEVGKDGWAAPAQGPINSPFGMRDGTLHSGVDLNGGGCGGPIWAAYPGTVTYVGLDSLDNGVVYIDHDGAIESRYVHMYLGGIFVTAGAKVTAGQHIAEVGSSGASSGCHLHFELKAVLGIGDWSNFSDPIPFLAERGITY